MLLVLGDQLLLEETYFPPTITGLKPTYVRFKSNICLLGVNFLTNVAVNYVPTNEGQSTNCDYAPIDNAWYWWALNSTVQIAKETNAVGDVVTTAELKLLTTRANSLMAAYDAEFWDPSCGCYRSESHRSRPGGTVHCATKLDNCTLPDDRVQALAIVTGLAPKKKWVGIVKNVLDLSSNTSVAFGSTAMEKFALEAMFLVGEHDAALVRMQRRFGPMIAYNLSTLWEHWEIDPDTGAPFAGYNHGWSGGALVLLSQYIAGLAPTSPGWDTFAVRPELGSTLTEISAAVNTAHGRISVALNRAGSRLNHINVVVEVPDGVFGQFYLPPSLGRAVRVSVATTTRNAVVVGAQERAGDVNPVTIELDGVRLLPGRTTIEAHY
jgi:hypothetical protein